MYLFKLLIIPSVLLLSCNKNKTEPICESLEETTYDTHVNTIISNNCMNCHDVGSDNGDFSTYSGLNQVLNNGSFEKAVLIEQSMPRFSDLNQSDLNTIQCWLEGGFKEN